MDSREKGSVRAGSICHDLTTVMAKTPDLKKIMAKIPDLRQLMAKAPNLRTLMAKRHWQLAAAALAVVLVFFFARGLWWSDKTDARAQGAGGRVVPVEVGKAERKKVPVRLDALGTVTPIASVALKARVDTTITEVLFRDGARVNKGDKLFTLDCRVMDAQIATTEGTLATAEVTLRVEDAIVVPSNAVQVSQTGSFVFVIEDGKSKVQPITVERQVGAETVVGTGLKGGETVVTDGQLLLSNGTRVSVRPAKPAGSGDKPAS